MSAHELVRKYYKAGLFAKSRAKSNTITTYERLSNVGIMVEVSDVLGRQKASELFQNEVERILNDKSELQRTIDGQYEGSSKLQS
ncbi:MAG: hypothetical protein WAS27_01680 [Candidatus Saccharimonadales bacterium]